MFWQQGPLKGNVLIYVLNNLDYTIINSLILNQSTSLLLNANRCSNRVRIVFEWDRPLYTD